MAAAEGEVPGPLTDWKPQVSTDERRMKLEDFPKTLYPPVHLDTRNNSKELWDNSRKGYPQIENVYLVSTENYGASGNCYFNAIATLLYGSQRYWHTVKGHHLEYVERVLRDKNHPRHTLYTQINSNLSQRTHDERSGLNLWMRLCTPYAWQDGEILQVTADLYDVFIVQYTMKSTSRAKVEGVKVRGNYNSTHWIIRYVDNNHFQPLIPASQPLSEFSFPQITRENTKGKVSIPQGRPKSATDLNHPWRSPISRHDVPEQLLPRQVFREMNALSFSLIAGFNMKDSTVNPKHLHWEYGRAATESLEPALLANGKETVESKIIEEAESEDISIIGSDISQSEIVTFTPPTPPSRKTTACQDKAVALTPSTPTTSVDPLPTPRVKSTLPSHTASTTTQAAKLTSTVQKNTWEEFFKQTPAASVERHIPEFHLYPKGETAIKSTYETGSPGEKSDYNEMSTPKGTDHNLSTLFPAVGGSAKKRMMRIIKREEFERHNARKRKTVDP